MTLEETKAKILKDAKDEIAERGYYTKATCGNHSNWSKTDHIAMQQIEQAPPADISVSMTVNFGVCDWTLTAKA
jgi:hypothetical protein